MSFAKSIEITAESPDSFERAVQMGCERATKTLTDVHNIWVKDQQVILENDKISAYRVHLKVTFTMRD